MANKFLSGINVTGTSTLNTVVNAGVDTDKFLVLDAAGNIDFRTGAELLSDIGASATGSGLPTGGLTGQILAKIDGTNYNTEWIDNYSTQVKNPVKLGATLSKGTPVYVSNSDGTNMIVSAASNASESASSKTFGLLETGGVTNDQVKVVTYGLLAGLNTSAATAGDPVWLGVNGALLYGEANRPVAPAHLVYIGVVTRVQSSNGEIFVNIENGFEMNELHNYAEGSVQNNQVIVYESATSLYKPKSISTILGYTPANAATYIPYTGATSNVDLGTYTLEVGDVVVGNNLYIGNWFNVEGVSGITTSRYFRLTDNHTTPTIYTQLQSTATAARTISFPNASGTVALTSDIPTLTNYVTLDGIQTISGEKTFANNTLKLAANGGAFVTFLSNISGNALVSSGSNALGFNGSNNLYFSGSDKYGGVLVFNNTASRYYTLQDANGTLAFTSDLSAYVPTSRTLTINGVTYDLTANRSWTIDAGGTSASTRTIQKFTSTASQTTFTITGGYTVGMVDVWLNGVKLDNATDFTAANGTTVVLTDALAANQTIEVYKYGSQFIVNNGLRQKTLFSATAGQITFTVNYSVGLVDVFYNGSKLDDTEYTATNGTTIVFNTACAVNDKVEVIAYTYNVGAFTGVGGSGTTNYLSKWTASGTLGNSLIFDNGTNVGVATNAVVSDALLPLQINAVATTGQAYFAANNNGSYGLLMGYDNANGYARIRNVSNTALTLETNNAERARITSGGNVLVGTTSDNGIGRLQVNGSINTYAGSLSNVSGSAQYLFAFDNSRPRMGILTAQTTNGAGAYYYTGIISNRGGVMCADSLFSNAIAITFSGTNVYITTSNSQTINTWTWSFTYLN